MNTNTDPELAAMQAVAAALADLGDDERKRVLAWAGARYGVQIAGARYGVKMGGGGDSEQRGGAGDFDDFAEFFGATTPGTDGERALVGAAWLSRDGRNDFQASDVNRMLKDLGHGVGNITDALTVLIRQKPQLVLQTQKTGTSKQARKFYRLTAAGQKRITQLLNKSEE